MKIRTNHLFLTTVALLHACSSVAWAQTVTKGDNTSALGLGVSWVGDVAPGSGNLANWSGTYNTAGSLSALLPGSALTWQGISIGTITGTAAGLVSIGGTGSAVASSSLTIGSSGIDLSGANQNLVINAATLNFNVSQTWNIGSGRNLRLGTSGTGAANANVDGNSASAVITVAGGGVVDANQGGSLGFSDAAGYAGFAGKWMVNSGTTLRGLRNGATAWGSNTAADAITLNGGTLAVGGISGSQGSWTWTTAMTLAASATSSIDQQIFSGTGRSLKLNGAISGSGNVVFRETGAIDSFNNDDLGFILTGANAMSGTVTIGGASENGISGRLTSVRIGGVSGNDTTTGAGTGGSLGTATVVNNGILTLSRSDTWTFGNTVSGTGSLRIGGGVTGSNTQIVTVSGANTYTGATTVGQGRLHLTGSLTSNISLAAAGIISGDGSTTGSFTTVAGAGILLAGGNTYTGLVANGVTIGGTTSVTFLSNPTAANTAYDVITYGAGGLTGLANLTAAWRGSFSNDTLNQKVVFTTGNTAVRTWNITSGTWDNTGANQNWSGGDLKFYDGDSAVFGNIASNAAITLSTSIAAGAVTVQNAANTYTFSGSGLGGAATLTKSNAGTLILTNANTYTGATTVSGGVLQVGNGGTTGSLGSGTISVAAGAEIIFQRSDSFTLANALSGAGLITKKGAGRMTVSANNSGGGLNWNFTGTGNGDIGFQNANAIGGAGSTINLADNALGSAFLSGSGNTSSVSISIGNGANFTWNGSTGNTNTISGVISGSGAFTKVSGENLILTGQNSFGGAISISGGGTLQIGGSGVLGSGNHTANISNANTLFVNSSSNQTLAGVISGGGALSKANTGTLSLTGANTFSGNTTVTSGTLAIANGGGIYRGGFNGSAVVTVGAGGVLQLQNWGYGETSASLGGLANTAARLVMNGGTIRMTESTTYGRGVTVNAGGATFQADGGKIWSFDTSGDGNTAFVYNDNPSLNFTGDGSFVFNKVFSGTGALNKSGAGSLTMPATSTHSGATMVSAGTLYVTGALANSAVTVDAGGAIGSAGTSGALNNGLTIRSGGILDLTGATMGSSSSGILRITGGTLALENLTFQNLVGWDWTTAAVGTYKLIEGAFTVDFGNTAYVSPETAYDLGDGRKAYFTQGSLNAVIIPETTTTLLAALGSVALLRRRRRL